MQTQTGHACLETGHACPGIQNETPVASWHVDFNFTSTLRQVYVNFKLNLRIVRSSAPTLGYRAPARRHERDPRTLRGRSARRGRAAMPRPASAPARPRRRRWYGSRRRRGRDAPRTLRGRSADAPRAAVARRCCGLLQPHTTAATPLVWNPATPRPRTAVADLGRLRRAGLSLVVRAEQAHRAGHFLRAPGVGDDLRGALAQRAGRAEQALVPDGRHEERAPRRSGGGARRAQLAARWPRAGAAGRAPRTGSPS